MEHLSLFQSTAKTALPEARPSGARTSAPARSKGPGSFAPNAGAGGLAGPWSCFLRRKRALALAAVSGALAGLLITLPQPFVYRANATLEVQGFNEEFLNLRNIHPTVADGSAFYRSDIASHLRILESRSLKQKVVERMMARPMPGEGRPATLASLWGGDDLLAWLGAAPSREEGLEMARDTLKATSSDGTRIVDIDAESTDPRLVAQFVNTLAEESIERNVEVRWQAIQRTERWLGGQLEGLREKLEQSEQKLQDYARTSGLLFTSEQGSVAEQKLRQLQEELSRAQADRIVKQSRYERAAEGSPETMGEILNLRTLVHYDTQATDLRRRLAELNAVYTAEDSKVKEAAAQLKEVERAVERERRHVGERIKNDYEAALRREMLLADDYTRQARLVSELAGRAIQYNIFKREAETNQQLYDSLLQKVKEAGVVAAMSASNMQVVDRAVVPLLPSRPSLPLNAAMGALCGLFAAALVVFARQQADLTLRQPGDVRACLAVRELGVIPASGPLVESHPIGVRRLRLRFRQVKMAIEDNPTLRGHLPVPVISRSADPSSRPHDETLAIAESFRATLTSILHAGPAGAPPRVVVVTSAFAGDGKTSVAGNLAVSFAEINQRVLLIDADLRKPQLHEIFDVSNGWGLTNLLQRRDSIHNCPFESIASETTVPGLYVLPSGPGVPAVANLLHSRRVPELLDRVRKEFDTVVIDTPPVMQVADTRVLGPMADGVVLVLRAGATTSDAARECAEQIRQDGACLLGAVLNFWDSKHGAYGSASGSRYTREYRVDNTPAARVATSV
jgi:polysaccharide biosynthesis transport protein